MTKIYIVGRHSEYGPFYSEHAAWRYMFGRDPVESEVEVMRMSGWNIVDYPTGINSDGWSNIDVQEDKR